MSRTVQVPERALAIDSDASKWTQHRGGGWVHESATVEGNASVGGNALVYGDAGGGAG